MESGLFRIQGGIDEIKIRSFEDHLSWVVASQLFMISHKWHMGKVCFVCNFAQKAFEEGMFCCCLEGGTQVVVHLWQSNYSFVVGNVVCNQSCVHGRVVTHAIVFFFECARQACVISHMVGGYQCVCGTIGINVVVFHFECVRWLNVIMLSVFEKSKCWSLRLQCKYMATLWGLSFSLYYVIVVVATTTIFGPFELESQWLHGLVKKIQQRL